MRYLQTLYVETISKPITESLKTQKHIVLPLKSNKSYSHFQSYNNNNNESMPQNATHVYIYTECGIDLALYDTVLKYKAAQVNSGKYCQIRLTLPVQ